MRPILLDTCAILWAGEKDGLSVAALESIKAADEAGVPVLSSPISAWEIGLLVARGRIALPTAPGEWFASFLAQGIALAPMTPQILVDSSFLPGSRLRDPADKIIAATARAMGYRVMTRDGPLLDYASAGHVQAIAC